MKISGTGAVPPPPDDVTATGSAAKPRGAEGAAAAFSEALEQAAGATGGAPAAGATGGAPAAGAPGVGLPGAIAADLRAGRITPEQAVERLVEETVTRRVGAQAPADLRERLRASLLDLLGHDPHLADLLRRLERAR